MEDWKNEYMVATTEPERDPDQAAADRNVRRKKRTQQPDWTVGDLSFEKLASFSDILTQ